MGMAQLHQLLPNSAFGVTNFNNTFRKSSLIRLVSSRLVAW
jgi:hypothetical protein